METLKGRKQDLSRGRAETFVKFILERTQSQIYYVVILLEIMLG